MINTHCSTQHLALSKKRDFEFEVVEIKFVNHLVVITVYSLR